MSPLLGTEILTDKFLVPELRAGVHRQCSLSRSLALAVGVRVAYVIFRMTSFCIRTDSLAVHDQHSSLALQRTALLSGYDSLYRLGDSSLSPSTLGHLREYIV